VLADGRIVERPTGGGPRITPLTDLGKCRATVGAAARGDRAIVSRAT
jgi:hypothetical protein